MTIVCFYPGNEFDACLITLGHSGFDKRSQVGYRMDNGYNG